MYNFRDWWLCIRASWVTGHHCAPLCALASGARHERTCPAKTTQRKRWQRAPSNSLHSTVIRLTGSYRSRAPLAGSQRRAPSVRADLCWQATPFQRLTGFPAVHTILIHHQTSYLIVISAVGGSCDVCSVCQEGQAPEGECQARNPPSLLLSNTCVYLFNSTT